MQSSIIRLRRIVRTYYRTHGRHTLPWRQTHDPYRILVSEVMLQQTQVARVVPKYRAFLRAFPTVRSLARAELRDVLTHWQGLGYNRRGKALHDAARMIVREYNGRVPTAYADLVRLPGVGPYTAAAVCAFAYNQAVPMLETNIRTVLFAHFFQGRHVISDTELIELATAMLDAKRPREWHWALMDYGAHLKAEGVRTNTQSKHYTKQSRFRGSDRELRGALVRVLTLGTVHTVRSLARAAGTDVSRVRTQLSRLKGEGMVHVKRGRWSL